LIQGDYYRAIEGNYDKAIEVYNKLLELDPDNSFVHNGIALMYSNLEDWDKAIEHLEVCRKNKAEFIGYYVNLANYYEIKGMYKEARETYRDYTRNFSDDARVHARIADSYVFEGKYDLALEELDKAFALDKVSRNKGRIYQLQGDFDEAEKEIKKYLEEEKERSKLSGRRWLEIHYRNLGQFEKALEQAQHGLELSEKSGQPAWKSWFYFQIGYYYFKRGKLEEALQKFNKVWDIASKNNLKGDKRSALYWKARTFLEMKSMDEALSVAEELKQIIESSTNPKNKRDYYNLLGMIEIEKKDFPKAIKYFERAYSSKPAQSNWINNHALYVFPLGLAYFNSGNLDKSLGEYEKIIGMTAGRLWYGDLYAMSFYMLGKIYEKKEMMSEARQNYEKFLDLWKNADPGIAEIEDAKKRLAGLKNSQIS
jgi:tetratricopeptide (TPR) repeat protein